MKYKYKSKIWILGKLLFFRNISLGLFRLDLLKVQLWKSIFWSKLRGGEPFFEATWRGANNFFGQVKGRWDFVTSQGDSCHVLARLPVQPPLVIQHRKIQYCFLFVQDQPFWKFKLCYTPIFTGHCLNCFPNCQFISSR